LIILGPVILGLIILGPVILGIVTLELVGLGFKIVLAHLFILSKAVSSPAQGVSYPT
jgi:hypothetical protein